MTSARIEPDHELLDTSALAKLFLVEPDSATFDSLAQRSAPIRISPLVRYEARLTFLRRE